MNEYVAYARNTESGCKKKIRRLNGICLAFAASKWPLDVVAY